MLLRCGRLRVLPLLLLAPLAHGATLECKGTFQGGQPPRVLDRTLSSRLTTLCFDAYALGASGMTKGALWSAEHLTKAQADAAQSMSRKANFHPEAGIPEDDRATLADYRNSGYDRGHMTPSGDMPTFRAQQQSFSLANVVPQARALNGGQWERIESSLRTLAMQGTEIYVVTGAGFDPNAPARTIGPGRVAVPDFVWKAIYVPSRHAASAWRCVNEGKGVCTVVSVEALAQATGVDPFPGLGKGVKGVVRGL
jgi:endonuclease G, mitochondrial